MPNTQYKENATASDNHDSWNLNICSKEFIQHQKDYYAREENHKRILERSKARQRENKEGKSAYDRKYYQWRKSWGDIKPSSGNPINNLLNIQGDVFTS